MNETIDYGNGPGVPRTESFYSPYDKALEEQHERQKREIERNLAKRDAATTSIMGLTLPNIAFKTGQSFSVTGCWPLAPGISLCISGGNSLTIGECCDSKTDEKRMYYSGKLKASFSYASS